MAVATLRFSAFKRLGGGISSLSANKGRLISLTSFKQGKLVPFKLADIGEGIREVIVKEWFVKPGDKISQFDNICEVQSDKASVTITSRYDGIIKKLHYKPEDTCLVGTPLVDIELEDEDKREEEESNFESEAMLAQANKHDESTQTESIKVNDNIDSSAEHRIKKVLTTPAVRKIAKENGVDLVKVMATGKDGRILKEDILAYLGKITFKTDTENDLERDAKVASKTVRPVKIKKYAKHMWKSMTQSLTIPHFVYSDEYDVSKLVRLRSEVKEAFEVQGISLSYMPFFIKAISCALTKFPELNACVNEKLESVDIREEHNISIAIQTLEGLIVPNIKNVQNLSIVDIAKELNRLQDLGKKSLIPLDDLNDGTFSISNIGKIGGTYTKPVILSPQVAIGALGQIKKLPRFDKEDKIVAKNILTVSWAADHRVIDGVTMAEFSNLGKYYIENPYHLIIGV